MKQILHLTATLTIIAALAGISIGYMNSKTSPLIAEQKKNNETSALTSLFPEGTSIEEKKFFSQGLKDTITFWVGTQNDTTIGYALKGGKSGYSSVISFLVALTPTNEILGLSILSQAETPGLGSRVMEVVSTSTFWSALFSFSKKSVEQVPAQPWFQEQFIHLSLANPLEILTNAEWHTLSTEQQKELQKKNQVTAITGATISTKAVCNGLETVAPILQEIKEFCATLNEQENPALSVDSIEEISPMNLIDSDTLQGEVQ